MRLLFAAALLLVLGSSARAEGSRVEAVPRAIPTAPLSPSLSPLPSSLPQIQTLALTPSLPQAAALSRPALPPAAVLAPAAASPEAAAPTALAAVQTAGQRLDAARASPASASGEASAVASLYGESARAPMSGFAVAGSPSAGSRPSGLSRATPRTAPRAKALPPGVKDAFQKSVLMTGGMGSLLAGLWPTFHAAVPQLGLAGYAAALLPISLLVGHFLLVGGFWAGRYYLYPKLGAASQEVFARSWQAAARVYPAVALAGLGFWAKAASASPALLAMMALPAAFAAGEVLHHFVWRLVPERAQDKGKPLADADSRLGGNIGQALKRLRRRA